jgi:hypothetical protein
MNSIEEIVKDEDNPLLRRLPEGRFTFANDPDREIAAARYFADIINSEGLYIKYAYARFWTERNPYEPVDSNEITRLSISLRPTLKILAEMLDDEKASIFVDVISESCIKKLSRKDIGRFRESEIFRELEICTRCIGSHPSLQKKERAIEIFKELLGDNSKAPLESLFDDLREEHIGHTDEALSALSFTNSSYVAERLITEMDYKRGYGIEYVKCLERLIKGGVVLKSQTLAKTIEKSPFFARDLFDIITKFGRKEYLEVLVNMLSEQNFISSLSSDKHISMYNCRNYFGTVFALIEKQGFDPNSISFFNEKISKSPEMLKKRYRQVLGEFAKEYLYKKLEKGNMQFWDYWMVYKPK